jgi:hypothetical protein
MNAIKYRICGKFAQRLGVSKKNLASILGEQNQDEDSNVLLISHDLCNAEIGISANDIAAGKMFKVASWKKSDLYQDMLELFTNLGVSAVAYMSGKQVMVVTQSEGYSGPLGLFIDIDDIGYVVETIEDYLDRQLPPIETD